MKILIDNGHGVETRGKRSPDGSLLEWRYTRQLALRLAETLVAAGYDTQLVVPEDLDVPLAQRVRRVNQMCRREKCVLISLHVNAAGVGGKWMQARGWGAYVAPNASAASRRLATALAEAASAAGLHVRRPSPSQPYWEQSLAICRDTACPAVLTENMFMDNVEDCAWLLTEQAKCALVKLHKRGIEQALGPGE